MKKVPEHIKDFCFDISTEDTVFDVLKETYGSYGELYKVKCTCNCVLFELTLDDHPTAYAKCSACQKEIILYELEFYPSAIKLRDTFPQYTFRNGNFFEICMYFEYPDDWEGNNDISSAAGWCYEPSSQVLIEFLNDETA